MRIEHPLNLHHNHHLILSFQTLPHHTIIPIPTPGTPWWNLCISPGLAHPPSVSWNFQLSYLLFSSLIHLHWSSSFSLHLSSWPFIHTSVALDLLISFCPYTTLVRSTLVIYTRQPFVITSLIMILPLSVLWQLKMGQSGLGNGNGSVRSGLKTPNNKWRLLESQISGIFHNS